MFRQPAAAAGEIDEWLWPSKSQEDAGGPSLGRVLLSES